MLLPAMPVCPKENYTLFDFINYKTWKGCFLEVKRIVFTKNQLKF